MKNEHSVKRSTEGGRFSEGQYTGKQARGNEGSVKRTEEQAGMEQSALKEIPREEVVVDEDSA